MIDPRVQADDLGDDGGEVVPGAELVKVTPMDFLSDILLWPRLIDKYKGTMTAAPNFAYNLLVDEPSAPWAVLPVMLNGVAVALVFPILTLAMLDMYPRQRGAAVSGNDFQLLIQQTQQAAHGDARLQAAVSQRFDNAGGDPPQPDTGRAAAKLLASSHYRLHER